MNKNLRRVLWSHNDKSVSRVINFISTPKRTGSSWLRRTLDEYFDMQRKMEPRGFEYGEIHKYIDNIDSGHHLFKIHCVMPSEIAREFPQARTVVLLRDIRDTFVSRYFLEVFHMGTRRGDAPKSFDHNHFKSFLHSDATDCHVKEHVMYTKEWDQYSIETNRAIWYNYKDLIDGTLQVFINTARYLGGIPVDVPKMEAAIAKQNFKAKTGVEPGNEDKTRFNRKGIVGDYAHYMNNDDISYLKAKVEEYGGKARW